MGEARTFPCAPFGRHIVPRKEYYQKHKEEVKAKSLEYKHNNRPKYEQNRDSRKLRVLGHYSRNQILGCCWDGCIVDDVDMLSVDHIDNDGAADRKKVSSGEGFYRRIEQEGYPERFQTLCFNHQWKKEMMRRREVRAQKFRSTLI